MSEHQHHGSWAVWLNDTDREPEGWTRLDVRPSNGAHVSEQDAEWLRRVIRAAAKVRDRGFFTYDDNGRRVTK